MGEIGSMDVTEQSKTHSDNDMSESAQNINLKLQIESRILNLLNKLNKPYDTKPCLDPSI